MVAAEGLLTSSGPAELAREGLPLDVLQDDAGATIGGATGFFRSRAGRLYLVVVGTRPKIAPLAQRRAGGRLPMAKIRTSTAPAMKPPMCAMKATPPPDCGPWPSTP